MIAFSGQGDPRAGRRTFLVSAAGGAARPLAPATSLVPEWRPDGREIKVTQCDKGYCMLDVWSVEGGRLRTLTTGREVFEVGLRWSRDGSQGLVSWEDVRGDGSNRVDVRSTVDGSARHLPFQAGFNLFALGYADGEKAAIVMAQPNGTSLQRIEVPVLAPAAKR
jgi:dipeptidyl aminopeptidase/acylaminoacyl peptidase